MVKLLQIHIILASYDNFYSESFSVETPTEKDLDNLSFGDLMYVYEVFYIANSDIVNVVMDDKREVDYV